MITMQNTGTFVDQLKAVGDENRFRLLQLLEEPRALEEIKLRPETRSDGYRNDRCLTRQGIQYHLDILRESGFVAANPETRGGRTMNVYRVEPGTLEAFTDQICRLASKLTEGAPPLEGPAQQLEQAKPPSWCSEPRLITLSSPHGSRAYPLSGKPSWVDRGWVVGRSTEADIVLPHDPYVPLEALEILKENGSYRLLTLRSARNPTFVNEHEVPRGSERDLDRGDLITLGRSKLLYHGPSAKA